MWNVVSLSCQLLEGRLRMIGEGQGDRMYEHALRTTIASSQLVRAQLDLLQSNGPWVGVSMRAEGLKISVSIVTNQFSSS